LLYSGIKDSADTYGEKMCNDGLIKTKLFTSKYTRKKCMGLIFEINIYQKIFCPKIADALIVVKLNN
jgi:hypothetical protein